MTIYPNPIPVHIDTGILHAVASYHSRKHKDTVFVFPVGKARYVHLTANAKIRVGRTNKIKKPTYNRYDGQRTNRYTTKLLEVLL